MAIAQTDMLITQVAISRAPPWEVE